jgi:hypothetical protein
MGYVVRGSFSFLPSSLVSWAVLIGSDFLQAKDLRTLYLV